MSKQDRQGVRTPSDIERKYDLASLVGIKKAVQNNVEGINKTNTTLENFMSSTLESITDLQSQIDGNVTTWFYSGVPSLSNLPASEWTTDNLKNEHLGDLYYDQDTGYAYRFALCNGVYKWLELSDSDVAAALALANEAKDTADGKRRVFVATPTVPYDVGDLWLNNEELYVCITASTTTYSEKHFEKATKYTDDTNLNNFVNVTYTESMKSLNELIDSKITTWYYSGVPTLSNAPAKDWTTTELKASHIGDLYYDKATGHTYRFSATYTWEQIVDSDLTEALALANSASDTADSKRRIFTAQPTPPYDNGDLWFNNQEIYICQISKAEGETYADKDFIIATKYTDDTEAIKVGSELKVVSGTVTTIKESFDEFKVEITDTVKVLDEELKTAETSLQLVQGQITSKIWENDIANALGGLEVGAVNLLNGSKDLSDSNSFFAEYNLTDGANQLTYGGYALCI